MSSKKTILFFHQSSDLYGSDKTLLQLVKGLNKNLYHPVVVLPSKGPLYDALFQLDIQLIVTPVLNIHKKMFTIKSLLGLPYHLVKSILKLNRTLKHTHIDIIQSNTTVVLLGFIYAKLKGITHFWHIHEVMEKPKVAVFFFPRLVNFCADKVIFNSKTTMDSFCTVKPKLKSKSIVIYNGLERFSTNLDVNQIKDKKQKFNIAQDHLVISLVGRFNNNKGHELLLKSFSRIIKKQKNIYLLFTGSAVKGKGILFENIQKTIQKQGLNEKVIILPFQNNIWDIWDITDIAVVPSTIKESFGLVALEAMLSSKPVVATDYGALSEVIIHNKTGLLFKLNDVDDLTYKLQTLITKESLRSQLGQNAKRDAQKRFSLAAYINQFEALYK